MYYMNLVSLARLERNPTVKTEIAQKGFGEIMENTIYLSSAYLDENQMRQALPIKWSSGTRPNKRESHRFTGLLDAIQ